MNKFSPSILYRCNNYILTSKASGQVCQPGKVKTRLGFKKHTVVLDELKKKYSDEKDITEWRNVQRLDIGVTGGLIIATNKNSAIQFSRNLKEGGNAGYKIIRRYVALLNPNSNSSRGLPEEGRIVTNNNKMITLYKQFDENCYIFELVSGMKHQIRIHASKVLEAPVYNDLLYKGSPVGDDPVQIALHSAFVKTKIGFNIREHSIPMPYHNKTLWDPKYIADGGYFIPEIGRILEEGFDSKELEVVDKRTKYIRHTEAK
ncbi:hypothetical protein TPHA_0L00870 [Tetrapisispora phaffii CBS 4417]|uniref:21S rRNA pseudouridine(2819) synthase n=1 Tax=Tetrapisispora phaffii (strain ATCC 24235 / CBS 4417 / NBRC 1672 / NRRL Y-8282 / UCD 70-5) TaxID=1071381 RepID=G8BZW6_TETPH|nr:hypothetical protein TPHA_0L00870 [Tetrapisispora phaffii CBS 4417]CCE65444.1 hypothetical protein TPHA_0L00870 [Tetrapisispora phaffii CBS 4417]